MNAWQIKKKLKLTIKIFSSHIGSLHNRTNTVIVPRVFRARNIESVISMSIDGKIIAYYNYSYIILVRYKNYKITNSKKLSSELWVICF